MPAKQYKVKFNKTSTNDYILNLKYGYLATARKTSRLEWWWCVAILVQVKYIFLGAVQGSKTMDRLLVVICRWNILI